MKKQLLAALLTLCMVLTLLPGTALADNLGKPYPATGGEVYIWVEDSEEYGTYASVSYCETSVTEAVIPNEMEGIAVLYIEGLAFYGCDKLTSVTLPSTLTRIYEAAFRDCTNLKDVYYTGSESQWKQITIDADNGPLTKATIHYSSASSASTPSTPAQTTPAQPANAVLSPQKLTVDGANINCEKYNIGGSNYFKLRDLAYVLNGTASQFEVGFDAATSTVSITTGAAYTSNGTELITGADNASTAQASRQTIQIDGVGRSDLTAYNIGGSNFFKLRDLGDALGFEVDFDSATNTAIVRSTQG